ncbi:MAG: hypothetical protein PHY16_18125 [Methylobacter sp.]|nr:hypothetical protein [Methylobacter sp.]
MIEVILLFILMFLIAACTFLPLGYSMLFFSKSPRQSLVAGKSGAIIASELKVPGDSTLRRHFLAHLQSEIESALFPRPADSILQRHYDALVAAELENRLAVLAE